MRGIKEAVGRLLHMFKVKDCHSICLFCEFFEICVEETERERERNE